jgi:hypothetical protein
MADTSSKQSLTIGELAGTVIGQILVTNEKSLLALGEHQGREVVIKALRTDEDFWRAKFDHEIHLYQTFALNPPPVRVPELIHTDGHRVLVIERIRGNPASPERYPDHPVPVAVLAAILDTITAFNKWSPPSETLTPVFDYPARIERYHAAGFFDDTDRDALLRLLRGAGPVAQPNHGDPLPANLLLTEDGGCVLLDFEFTGLFLPGFDLAMLHTLLAETPQAQARIDALVSNPDVRAPFLINQAMVLSRELRLHWELPEGEFRDRRLNLLEPQWVAVRDRLHTRT